MDLSTVEFTSIITLEDLIFVLNCVFDTVCKVLKFGKYFAFWLLRGKPIENERIGKKKGNNIWWHWGLWQRMSFDKD